MSTASLAREVERLKARSVSRRRAVPTDPVEFARALGIEPDPWQVDLLLSDARHVLLNCSRQSGKSMTAGIIALYEAMHNAGALVLALAPAERQSKELFAKITAFYRKLGQVIPADSYRKLGMELANGSRIEALPGTEKTIRSFSEVALLVVDEAARIDDALYYAVRPMLAVSGGRLLMLSSPYGKRGVFYEEWTSGVEWRRFEVPATECPRIPDQFLGAEKKSMPEWWFEQEYMCRFMETEDQVFTHAMIAGARADDLPEYRFEGDENLWS